MLNPDQVLFLSAALNLVAYLDIVYRRRRKQSEEDAMKEWKFKRMWRVYAKEHDIPLNGDD